MSSKSSKPARKKRAPAGRKFKPVGKTVPITVDDYEVVRLGMGSEVPIGPTPERVAARALALTSVAYRAHPFHSLIVNRRTPQFRRFLSFVSRGSRIAVDSFALVTPASFD